MAKANFDAVSATKTTVSDRRCGTISYSWWTFLRTLEFAMRRRNISERSKTRIRKNSQSPMLICPK